MQINQRTAKVSKNEYAYEAIKAMIMDGTLQSNELLSESILAEKLGMSRTPIREAMRMLSRDGFIKVSGQGAYVKSITFKEAYDLSEIRVAIECIALKTAVHHVPLDAIDSLLERWNALLDLVKGNLEPRESLLKQILALDVETHMTIIRHCDNSMIPQLYENVLFKVQWFQQMVSSMIANDEQTVRYHIELLQRVREKDVPAASDIIQRHVYDSLQRVSRNKPSMGANPLDMAGW